MLETAATGSNCSGMGTQPWRKVERTSPDRYCGFTFDRAVHAYSVVTKTWIRNAGQYETDVARGEREKRQALAEPLTPRNAANIMRRTMWLL
ncbi:hypothetical protein GCM10007175_05630 [Pseudarthrobacter scleromae]|uniref:Transposase n=1 Tax=Pseudarthrobacter scleromae TaxID=158897 RepID=A0ABQ2CA64_9MICC|nr:hypothetical protein GCM10007175_05630 [Pseudarthrobacter scleromae]